MEDIILIGGGGHCKVIIDIIRATKMFNIYGIIDKEGMEGKEVAGVKIIGNDDDVEPIFNSGIKNAFITIGSIDVNNNRMNLFDKLELIGYNFPIIKSEKAIISGNVVIGKGTVIMPGVIINPGSIIGNNCIINTGSIIEHDCRIGDGVHIAPGSTLSGGVSIGKMSHIGTGSTIIQGIKIGEHTLIGAGSVVIDDIPSQTKAFGNPARIRSKL
jgi:sugar O-acyltransferase (sialic acid O-acetyltransferase NeuD family)